MNRFVWNSLFHASDILGRCAIKITTRVGQFMLFLGQTVTAFFNEPPQWKRILAQIEAIGFDSLSIVMLTGTFSGMVFALQSYIGFSRIGGHQFIGSVVALGMARELGPVMTGLMVTARACSAMAAELGTMRVTEQIDALITLRINTFSYLITPRLIASILVLPCLTLFATVCGILGGYMVVVHLLHLSSEQYLANITQLTTIHDLINGLIKSIFFGLILAWVGCYKGYYTQGGARGVGSATTQAVVLACVLILTANFFLTKLLDHL